MQMEHKQITLIDVIESFLTGISCLVGVDQLYLFISQTNANPLNQYNYSLFISAFTLTIAFVLYDEYKEDFMNAVHLVYVTLLLCLVLILYSRIRSTSIVTLCNISISIVLTIFVLLCCISYSVNRVLLLTFILGLFGSRLLPTLCWLFIENIGPDFDTQLSNFALKLYLVRFIICMTSIIIKIINNNFGLSLTLIRKIQYDFGPIRLVSFATIFEHFKNLYLTYSYYLDDDYYLYLFPIESYIPLLFILPYFCFFSSFIIISILPPSVNFFSYKYSYNVIHSINIFKKLSYFVGIGIGITHPASNTVHSASFKVVYFIYVIYICILVMIYRHYKVYSDFIINLIVIISGIFLGYLYSYNLAIIYNTTLNKMCVYEEYYEPCFCDIEHCYCEYKRTIKDIKRISYGERRIPCENLIIGGYNILNNSTGSCGILILYKKDGEDAVYNNNNFKCCTEECKTISNCNGNCKCLKLVGIYKLDTLTTSSCDDCQLTVRLEAKKICSNDNCPGTGGDGCRCTVSDCKCCCLAVGCCKPGGGCTTTNCNCIKLCCCKNCDTCTNCKCEDNTSNEVRIFFGYIKNGECCIKEIKPANPQFEGSLGKQNEFYIGKISLGNCCHVDLQVDLHCYMKNSFYRMTGVNYIMKSIIPKSITFMRDIGECCTTPQQSQCCCINTPLVRLCVEYEQDYIYNDDKRKELNKCQLECKCPEGCSHTCGCCPSTGGKCCCCKTFQIDRSVRSSFYKRMEPVKIKLIILFLLLFIALDLITSEIVSDKNIKKSKLCGLKPIRSFDKICKSAKQYKINNIESVNKRLNNAVSSETNEISNIQNINKQKDLDNMLTLFKELLDDKSFNKLKKYINKNSDEHIKKTKSNNANISKDDIIWSYCTGFMYSYVIEMFLIIQEYFFKWEFVWQKEYFNYRKMSNIEINRIINKSNYSFSLLTDLNIKEKIPYCITKQRTKSFNKSYDELFRYVDINENELKNNQEITNDIVERLKYFIDRWNYRINLINHLIDIDSNMFDWDQMLNQYPFILQWVNTFYPYLERAAKEIYLELKKLNRGKFMFEYITSY